ncbi:unnamed protein product [Effrenium voratum]|uniref:FAD-binding PCMH-type domain-containing protein n=1 Tax=Effrenium voratum TaxID=2562239 RepID=A0AA36IJI7_9DINO|nr:unnamed protein product [Effrenium voratum]
MRCLPRLQLLRHRGCAQSLSRKPREANRWQWLAGAAAVAGAWGRPTENEGPRKAPDVSCEHSVEMINWSGTHGLTTRKLFQPESERQLLELLRWASQAKQKVRPVGMNLSPNGLALQEQGMVSMSELDAIRGVDLQRGTITVQAGCRVSQILEELRKRGLTLENFSSITEQQAAGWTQVSAHGTGARIPPVDEMVVAITAVSPEKGVLKLTEVDKLFPWMRVGLGALGVVQELTLKVIPRYTLHEKTYCCTYAELERDHKRLLQTYRHVRYMWIPYTDTIVVVVSNVPKDALAAAKSCQAPLPEAQRVEPLRRLLRQLQPNCGDLDGKNFAELREKLLVLDPLNPSHVAKVNQAEAQFWRKSSGERVADSTEILGFECGGSQWVLENCFPCGTIDEPNLRDIQYVKEMKDIIEANHIAAASPIEQRWTSRSTSPMSPAFSKEANALFSWVGVIMYITSEQQAPAIKAKFKEYAKHHADLTFKYGGFFHWGKVDLAFHEGPRREGLRKALAEKFDLGEFRRLKQELDPNNVLGNAITDVLLWG